MTALMNYWETFKNSFGGYWNYLVQEVTLSNGLLGNYFYYLVGISLIAMIIEAIIPWRKQQSVFRKQFWLDFFYMFFNFFIFNLIIFIALSNTASLMMKDFWGLFGITIGDIQLVHLEQYPKWVALLIFFIVSDFFQWLTHRLLHRSDFLWKFHKVHHSVEEMSFPAHLRYHWMETIVYKSIQYIPLALIGGFSVADVFIVHYISIAIGHLNHINANIDYGPLKYIFNNPRMHIWHHAKDLPADRRYGVNFGLTFSFWDYMFGTAYIPSSGKDIPLGFENVEKYPSRFFAQMAYPFKKEKK